MTSVADLPFDRVSVYGRGRPEHFSSDSFMKLRLDERVRLVLEGTLRFFSGETEVERSVALAALRKIAVARRSPTGGSGPRGGGSPAPAAH